MSRQRIVRFIICIAAFSLLISACTTKTNPTATLPPTATAEIIPTAAPTHTPVPTLPPASTASPEPAATLEPTVTTAPADNPTSMTFTDGLGRTITLSGPAQRVVSLAPSNTEILYYVGAGAQMIGRDEFSDYPAEALKLPAIGGSWGGYNLEAIVALKPDLVLAAEINTLEQVQALADLGLTVYYLANPVTLPEMYGNLEIIARMTGHEAETAVLIDSLKTRVLAVVENVKRTAVNDRPLVYYELDATDPNAPFTFGANTFLDALITVAGGVNAGGTLDTAWAPISAEKVIELNPIIILLGDAAYGITPESVAARPGWKAIEAVKNSNIYPFDDNLVSRPGPRLVDGLEALVKIIHPELYR
jgi:iron complex transport system substrate-binding protein